MRDAWEDSPADGCAESRTAGTLGGWERGTWERKTWEQPQVLARLWGRCSRVVLWGSCRAAAPHQCMKSSTCNGTGTQEAEQACQRAASAAPCFQTILLAPLHAPSQPTPQAAQPSAALTSARSASSSSRRKRFQPPAITHTSGCEQPCASSRSASLQVRAVGWRLG